MADDAMDEVARIEKIGQAAAIHLSSLHWLAKSAEQNLEAGNVAETKIALQKLVEGLGEHHDMMLPYHEFVGRMTHAVAKKM